MPNKVPPNSNSNALNNTVQRGGVRNRAEAVNNDNIELAEIRYGQIANIASSKPSLWFILNHKKESNAAEINQKCLFQGMDRIYKNDETLQYNLLPDVPISVVEAKATSDGSNTYVLLAQHAEQSKWALLRGVSMDRLVQGETAVVHLADSLPQGRHRCATWSTQGE
ncbi:hypothetical protein PISL3812_09500 [Talaromyces islandicus]|uniref:Uncharacterized protein n=1 Tax=Talaromyces islandicus TaxID=28573 RepID=A0A0U1MBR2_TALIS|nr:hypothetical protein PISL3812_09500 [Talaromyces islandicus]